MRNSPEMEITGECSGENHRPIINERVSGPVMIACWHGTGVAQACLGAAVFAFPPLSSSESRCF